MTIADWRLQTADWRVVPTAALTALLLMAACSKPAVEEVAAEAEAPAEEAAAPAEETASGESAEAPAEGANDTPEPAEGSPEA